MLAWATVNDTVTGAASTSPFLLLGPPVPEGMVRVSELVGMNGAPAVKLRVAGPTACHVPATGGSNVG